MIQVKDLNYTYKKSGTHAVKGINFEVAKGEIFGFLGPSGAGKSTTQKVLIKLLDGFEGEVSVFGESIESFDSSYYEKVGVSFELPNNFLKLTALENLDFFQNLYKNKTNNISELLDKVGLGESKNIQVENFSKGMKMRLNFARSLINDADILFFDEPTSGLDPVNAKKIKDIISKLKSEGKTIFITTHDMYVADALCDRVGFIVDGEIAELDTPKNLKLKYGEENVTVEYYKNDEIVTETFPLKNLGENEKFLGTIKNKIRMIHSTEMTLEDVFIKVTGRSLS